MNVSYPLVTPGEADRVAVGKLLKRLYQQYSGRLTLDFCNPRSIVWIFHIYRYRIDCRKMTWILGDQVIYRGIPSWDELRDAIDEALRSQKCAGS